MGLLPLQVRVEAREALTTFSRAHLSNVSKTAISETFLEDLSRKVGKH